MLLLRIIHNYIEMSDSKSARAPDLLCGDRKCNQCCFRRSNDSQEFKLLGEGEPNLIKGVGADDTRELCSKLTFELPGVPHG